VWAEVWPLLAPQVEAVMLRGESTWNERAYVVLERHGFREDAWFTWSYSPIRDEAGRISGLMCISTEDTARVLAERERDQLEEQRQNRAEQTQAKLAAIVESSDDAIIGKSLDGIIATWNGGAERLFGYAAEEVVGHSISVLIPQDRRHEEADIQERLGRGESVEHFETVRITKDGRKIDVSLTISPIKNSAGKIIGASKIVRDVSERKRAEVKLEENQIRTRFAMEIMEAGEWELNLSDNTAHRSLQHDRIFGYESLLPSWTYEMFLEHVLPEDRDGVDRAFREAMETRQTWDFECRIVRRDQTVRWIKAAGRHFALGNTDRLVGVVQDISERKQAEESLARQAEELARSNVELERFAYVASHDLQEPMRTVQRFAQLLQRNFGESLKGEAKEFFDFIIGGVQRMQTLLNDLLAYSRVGSQGAAFAPANCKEICANVLESLQASVESHQAKVTVEPLPVVIGDATQLGQMFQNLLVNAIKFHGQRTPRVHVSVKEASSEWVFSVADNGIGIASEYFDRIFIIFQRLHTIEEYGGTGIGLAICKKIAERHGGRIWVESVVGEGSIFHFSIPKREKLT
jgi:PAS domain S-box-containing protein